MNSPTPRRQRAALLTPDEICAMLRISKKALYRLVERGGIPVIRISRRLRFHPDDIDTWLRQMRAAGSEEKSNGSNAMERKVDSRSSVGGRDAHPTRESDSDPAGRTAIRSRASRGACGRPVRKLIDLDAVLNRGRGDAS